MKVVLEALNLFFDSLPYPAQRDVAPDVADDADYVVWTVTNELPDDEQGNYGDDVQGLEVRLQVRCWSETGAGAATVHDDVEVAIRSNPLNPTGYKQIRRPRKTLYQPVRDQDGRHHQIVSEWYITLTKAP